MPVKTALTKSKTPEPSKASGLARRRQSVVVSSLITRERVQRDRVGAVAQDRYELEADRVAEQLVDGSGQVPDSVTPASPDISLLPQRLVSRQPDTAVESPEQSSTLGEQAEQEPQAPELESSPGPAFNGDAAAGRPLPADIRPYYESRLQRDLSGVRLHTGSRAETLCARIRARAFTYGHAIYFGAGQFNPRQRQGRLLLAHELVHVVQQGRAPRIQRKALPGTASQAPSPPTAQTPPSPASGLPPQPTLEARRETAAVEQRVERENQRQQAQARQQGRTQQQSLERLDAEAAPEQTVQRQPAEDQVAVELPEQPELVREEVARVEAVNLQGSSDQAMLAFTDASPSSMALSQPQLAPTLDGKLDSEAKEQADNAPKLAARASGQSDLQMVSPEPQAQAAGFEPDDQSGPEQAGELKPEAHENLAPTPDNKDNERLLERRQEGGFLSWFRSSFSGFLNRIRTTDNGLNTNAGERRKVQLEGDADPERANLARRESNTLLAQQRDQTAGALRNHPGQSNIQAKAVDETKTPELKDESNVEITQPADQGMADYAAMPLPADVRAKSDELLQPSLDGNLAEARKQTEEAAGARDRDKQKEISRTESQAQALNQQADQDQRQLVLDNRAKVAEQQRQGIREASDTVKQFDTDAGGKQTGLSTEVRGKVKDSQEAAAKELKKGEDKAEAKRKEGERDAAAKKRELEKEQDNDSWWDRAVNAVKRAVKAITDAIDKIFTAIRKAVKEIIEAAKKLAVDLINKARDWIVDKLDKFRDWAKEQVNKYLKDSFPGLAKRINDGIDAVVDVAVDGVNAVADTLIKGVEALADGLAAALDKILATFQTALKAAVQIAGAVLTGDFAEALRIAIRAACEIAGIDPQPIFDFIDRAKGAVTRILQDPVGFFMNLVNGVGGGVRNFAKNIKKHLINGLLGWLTGALSEVPISLPEKFDFKGILHLALQVLGLTYDNIKARVIKRFPPAATVFDLVEKGVQIVRRILVEGPIAIWQMVKESLSNLKEMVLSGIRNFVIVTVVKEAVGWLLGLLNPAGAIVKVVKLLYEFVMFLIERFQQIKDFIVSVYQTISAIASGALGKVMSAVEDALARSLPVVISLLASLAGLGGIGKTVQNIIGKVSRPVNKVIDKIIDKVINFVKGLLGKGKKEDEPDKQKGEQGKDQSLGPVNLADLNKSPVPAKRTAKEKQIHYDRTLQLLKLIGRQARTSDDMQRYFPKLKKRYRLAKIEYEQAGSGKLGIQVKLNPEGYFYDFAQNMLVKADDGDEAVKVNQIDMVAQTLSLSKGGQTRREKVGKQVTAEYLAFNHPQGSETSSREQATLFSLLPTVGPGHSRFIRGHLLNANLGGKAEEKNLFPITHQANVDHKNKIENEAKRLVNQEGYLVYYEVRVNNVSTGEDPNYAYANADFDCELATYGAKQGKLVKSDKAKKVSIKSRYTESKEAVMAGETDTSQAAKLQDFDKNKVKLASGLNVKYLSEMSANELRSIPGIGKESVRRLMEARSNGTIRTSAQLRQLIGTRQVNKLRDAGFELRLYRNEPAE
jgi:hypothetical protein